MPRKKSKPPELLVIFDTNAIFTESAAHLLKREVADLIRANLGHADVRIRWFVPSIVVHERQYQMQQNGFALLSSIEKIERVLGHNLNITEQVVVDRVARIVEQEIADLQLEVLDVDTANVDWPNVIVSAAYRRPPFERGEKEKGFRDAVILEAILQLVAKNPTTPKVCRIVIVTRDGLLSDAARSRTAGASNVRILTDLEELKGLINTLVSEVSEEFVSGIHDAAANYFFEKDDEDTLYYRERINERIATELPAQYEERPKGSDGRDLQKILIGGTRFKQKTGQRVHWVTRITFEWKAYKSEARLIPPAVQSGITQGQMQVGSTLLEPPAITLYQPSAGQVLNIPSSAIWESPWHLGNVFSTSQTKRFVATGQVIFEVTWSVTVSAQRLNFTSPRVEGVEFISSEWKDSGA